MVRRNNTRPSYSDGVGMGGGMKGSVDIITSDGTMGWLFGPHASTKPMVEAYLNNRLIGQAVADMHRPDLEQVGFGDGHCGFDIRFNQQIDASYLPFITVRPNGSDLTIPVYGNAAFKDFVLALTKDFPGTGRNRSVLGGLWTDRTDAPLVLAGRIAVGACLPELQTALQSFIANGHVTLNGVMAPAGVTEKELELIGLIEKADRKAAQVPAKVRTALNTVSSFLFRDTVVKILRAVFDDHPVAYKLDVLTGPDQSFVQACAFETFPSPAECVVGYIAGEGSRMTLAMVRNSHELPEFAPGGASRWTASGVAEVANMAQQAGASVEAHDLEPADMVLVGPGLVHQMRATGGPVLRVMFAPRRITPVGFLNGHAGWIEGAHVSGARVRL